jgi:hypothetical protein
MKSSLWKSAIFKNFAATLADISRQTKQSSKSEAPEVSVSSIVNVLAVLSVLGSHLDVIRVNSLVKIRLSSSNSTNSGHRASPMIGVVTGIDQVQRSAYVSLKNREDLPSDLDIEKDLGDLDDNQYLVGQDLPQSDYEISSDKSHRNRLWRSATAKFSLAALEPIAEVNPPSLSLFGTKSLSQLYSSLGDLLSLSSLSIPNVADHSGVLARSLLLRLQCDVLQVLNAQLSLSDASSRLLHLEHLSSIMPLLINARSSSYALDTSHRNSLFVLYNSLSPTIPTWSHLTSPRSRSGESKQDVQTSIPNSSSASSSSSLSSASSSNSTTPSPSGTTTPLSVPSSKPLILQHLDYLIGMGFSDMASKVTSLPYVISLFSICSCLMLIFFSFFFFGDISRRLSVV